MIAEQGEETCRVVVDFEVPLKESQLKELPISGDAIQALVRESKGITEGKNTLKISIKRDFGRAEYGLILDQDVCSFPGDIKGSPVLTVVMGTVVAQWKVEALVDPDVGHQLIRFVEREGLKLKVKLAQGELPLEATG
jgi:hypothetical protein